jgi:hypothetical protein
MAPKSPKPKRELKPFAGLTRKPEGERCARESEPHPQVPGAPPPRMRLTRGCRHQVDTTGHFCSHVTCSYHGWVGWGSIRANGHPNDHRWRQLVWLGCRGYFLETVGTPFHGKQVDPDKLVGGSRHWLKVSVFAPWFGLCSRSQHRLELKLILAVEVGGSTPVQVRSQAVSAASAVSCRP